MINLLSNETKNNLRAAHSNATLLKYLLVTGLGVIFLALVSFGTYLVMTDIKTSAENSLTTNQEQSSSYSDAQTQANTLKASLAKAKNILDSEVQYSKLLTSIAALMPTGTIIDSLSLNSKIFESPITLSVYADSTETALKLKEKFQSSPLFSGVSFQSITNSSNMKVSGYSVTATVSLSITKGALK